MERRSRAETGASAAGVAGLTRRPEIVAFVVVGDSAHAPRYTFLFPVRQIALLREKGAAEKAL